MDPELAAFHRGDRRVLEAIYREHFDDVVATARRLLGGADHESVAQQVFLKMLSSEAVRRSFQGGSFSSWLTRTTQNQALEHLRRRRTESRLGEEATLALTTEAPQPVAHFEAAQWVSRFRESLPSDWLPIFELCFIKRLDQRAAARALGIARTTLAYRAVRIRWKLRDALLKDETT